MPIPFDSLTLAAVAAELRGWQSAKVQKVLQDDAGEVGLELYQGGRVGFLLLSAHPEFARVHLATRRLSPVSPPPPFCAALRKYLDGARLLDIRQVGFDRVLHLDFERGDEPFRLIAEIMGKHSNLVLLDREGKVQGAAKWVGRRMSKRPIQPGAPYAPPPFEPRPSLLTAPTDADLEGYEGASPFLRRLLAAPGGPSLAEIQDRVRSGSYAPVFVPGEGAYPVSIAALGYEELPRETIGGALEQYFNFALPARRLESLRQNLLGQLKRVLLARETALRDLTQAQDAAAKASSWQLRGELLLAFMRDVPSGAKLWETEDYEGAPLRIALDPALTPKENAERYFDKARHAKERVGAVGEQRGRIEEERDALTALIAGVESAPRLEALEALREEAKARRWLNKQPDPTLKKEERPYAGHRIREILAPGGYSVLYGENAESNDYLTLRVAKPNDYWLHVRGSTSAHVVIQTQNRPEKVGLETLRYAAKIAVLQSPSKHAGYVPVDYTLKKYVRKPKGAPKGTAFYTHEKTLHLEGHELKR